jgi:acid phosphatase
LTSRSGVVAACATLTLATSPLLAGAAVAHDHQDGRTTSITHRHHDDDHPGHRAGRLPGGFKHLVVIYEENHSFDNLYGHWGLVGDQQVDGVAQATPQRTPQVDQHGNPYQCLLQDDVNLTSPDPLPTTCVDGHHVNKAGGITTESEGFVSHFANAPFSIEDFIRPEDTTCPAPGDAETTGTPKGEGVPSGGGCTRDIVHRFYQEQYQLNGGQQNRYVTASDAAGLTMGTYDTTQLPIYKYLHSEGAPKYVIADRFFQAAFGGSFLNHQWLIAARSPLDTSQGEQRTARNSVLDANGMVATSPLYTPEPSGFKPTDGALTQECPGTTETTRVDDPVRACGDFAVNTVQPSSEPFQHPSKGKPVQIPLIDDSKYPNIGDELSNKGVSWNWYAGGWDAVNEDPASAPLFQFHHQPFNYFANYAEGAPGRSHLRDENEFKDAVDAGTLPKVSFVKPYGAENEHPGYASEPDGSDALVDLLQRIMAGPQADSTLVVVTYDEFGGQWDHVPPPGMGTPGQSDAWGPGTRIPALVLSRSFCDSGVDHTSYDTTSILATIEHSYHLDPLSSRDAEVKDLRNAVAVAGVHGHHHGHGHGCGHEGQGEDEGGDD